MRIDTVLCFFFSSRRRHTRLQGDWSSDVCSSDLVVCTDMPCAHACATGALVPPAGGWDEIHMGVLELDPERCITFQGVSCGVCARACPVGERALAMDAGGHPGLRPEGCVGCGGCVTACVTSPSSLQLRLATDL